MKRVIYAIETMFICCLIFTGTIFSQEDYHEDKRAQVEALCDACDKPDIPGGYAVAVIKNQKVEFQKPYGYSNYEHEIPFSSSTVFDFASVAKQFTGFAIALLVEQGKISLNDDIRQYLPEVPDFGEIITIRHLLFHTSGIRDWVGLVKLSGRYKVDVITDEFLMGIVKHQRELHFKPGERFLYSNTGYFLLAQIISRVTNKSFREWTDENIFKPLEMNNTLFLDDYREIIKGRASSYKRGKSGTFANNPSNLTSYGSSSLFSTVDDMIKWVLNFEERKIGGDNVWNMMLEKGILNNGQKVNYGFGLSINDYHGIMNYGHGGSWGGCVCQITYFPNQRFAFIFVSNRDPSGVYVDKDVYKIFMSEIPSDKISPKKEIVSLTEVEIDPDLIEEYIGVYVQESRVIKVEKMNSSLVIHLPWEKNIRVVPESDNKFFMKGGNGRYSFQRDGDGKVYQLTIHTSGDGYLYRKLDSKASGYNDVEELCGEYFCTELQTTYNIKIKDDQLIVEHFQNEDILLMRLDKNHYLGDKWWFSEIEFLRNENNNISGFRLNADQGSVKNLLMVRK